MARGSDGYYPHDDSTSRQGSGTPDPHMYAATGPTAALADEYFFIAHDHHSGRSFLAPPVVALGLSAALLAELMFSEHVSFTPDGLITLYATEPPRDALSREIVSLLERRPHERDVSTWLQFLAAEATTDVGERLVAQGSAQRSSVGRLGRRQTVFLPVNVNSAAWPSIRLARQLTEAEPMEWTDAALAALVAKTGLMDQVLWDPEGERRARGTESLATMMTALSEFPELHVLVKRTEVAVAEVMMLKH
jgi:hypothetical protein